MKALTLGGYRVILKPSMLLIIGGILFGIIGAAALMLYPRVADALPAYGHLDPVTWKFECRAPAQAEISGVSDYNTYGGFDTKKQAKNGASGYRLDMENGVAINVKQVGPTPDYVYLRDGLNLEPLLTHDSATLTLEGKASEAHTALFTIRDSRNLLWSQEVKISGGDWQKYSLTIPTEKLSSAIKVHVIFAVQVGGQRGEVFLRNVLLH